MDKLSEVKKLTKKFTKLINKIDRLENVKNKIKDGSNIIIKVGDSSINHLIKNDKEQKLVGYINALIDEQKQEYQNEIEKLIKSIEINP